MDRVINLKDSVSSEIFRCIAPTFRDYVSYTFSSILFN